MSPFSLSYIFHNAGQTEAGNYTTRLYFSTLTLASILSVKYKIPSRCREGILFEKPYLPEAGNYFINTIFLVMTVLPAFSW